MNFKQILFIKRFRFEIIALFFTFVGFYLRFDSLAKRDLWCDEIWQLAQTVGQFKPIWKRLHLIDVFTSFSGDYLLNYPFVRFFGSSKWVINIPHYFATFFGFLFLYLLCKRYLKTSLAFAITFLIFCFNRHLIFHSFEFRPYAVLPTLSLATFYFMETVISDWCKFPLLKRIFLGGFFIFVVIYHIYGITIVGFCLLYFIILEAHKSSYKEAIKKISPFLLSVGLPVLLLFFWYISGTVWHFLQIGSYNIFEYSPNPINDFPRFIRQVFSNLMGNKKYGQKLLGLGIWIAFLLPQKDRLKQLGFFLVFIIMPILTILISDLRSGYWFLERQYIWVMSLYAFFLGWCWDTIFRFIQKKFKTKL